MASHDWFGSMLVRQARSQWGLVAAWSASIDEVGEGGWLVSFKRPAVWLVAAGWRIAIGLALILSLLAEAGSALLRPVVLFIDGLLGWLLLPITAPVEAALSIPYLGRALGWLWRASLTLLWGLLHGLEAPLVLLSLMPRRRLRLWVLPTGMADSPDSFQLGDWLQAIDVAGKILEREANVQLVPVVPWESPGETGALSSTVDQYPWIRELPLQAVGSDLKVACNLEGLKEDLGPVGGKLDRRALLGHPRGSYRRVSGWGAPIMAVSVRSVAAGRLAGCSLGPLTDYITVRVDLPVCLAHEIAHACNLGHHEAANNLMNPTCGGVHLTRWQVLLLRLSRHTTYL